MTAAEEKIDGLFAPFDRADRPGYAVCVCSRGETIYRRGFGMADLEHNAPISSATIFHVASVSKQFTALCILLLAQENRLSLSDDIHRWLPELPAYPDPITLWQMLHHVSGLREQWDLFTLSGHTMEDRAERAHILRLIEAQQGVNSRPGAEYCYCNSAFTLLAEVIRAASGQTLRQFADERIFRPLGMTQSYFRDDHGEIVPGRAVSYRPGRSGGYAAMALNFDLAGSTSLNTTADDLMKWLAQMDRPRAEFAAPMARMTECYTLRDGTQTDYGCGLRCRRWRGLRVREHSGANSGFRSAVLYCPDLSLEAAVLSNWRDSYPIEQAYRILERLAGDMIEPQPAPPVPLATSPAKEEGLYRCGVQLIAVQREEDNLCLAQEGACRRYRRGADGGYEGLAGRLYCMADGTIQLQNSAGTTVCRPADDLPLTPADAANLPGEYYAPEIETVCRLTAENGRLVLHRMRFGATPLRQVEPGLFLAEKGEGLAVQWDSARQALLFSTVRTRRLEFFRGGWRSVYSN